MPTYKYRCECGHTFELTRSVSERKNAVCKKCGAVPRIVIAPVPRTWTTDMGQ